MRLRRRGEDGAALAELAICLPFLAMIVFGTIDLGRLYETQQQLKAAAREGAIYGSRFPGRQTAGSSCPDPDNIVWHANHEGRTFTIRVNNGAPQCLTSPLPASLQPGQPLKVTASRGFQLFTPFVNTFFGTNPTVSSSVCVNISGATPDATVCP